MTRPDTTQSDAFVFFGATGDLAFKKIFPALQALVKRDRLDIPVVGVAKAGYTREMLVNRARESLVAAKCLDEEAFTKLASHIRYVDGDYNDPHTFQQIRTQLATASRPIHYLAIPPSMFPTVVHRLHEAGCKQCKGAGEDVAVQSEHEFLLSHIGNTAWRRSAA